MSRTLPLLLVVATLAGCGRGSAPDAADIAANNRGVGLMGMFKYPEAHDVFASLADEHPVWADVKVNLAIAALNRQEEGDETRALDILRQVLEAEPGHLRARYCAGLLLYRAADEAALEHLAFVARRDPQDPYAAYFYGSALEQAGRTDEARAMYERALELDPYLRSAAYRLSRVLLMTQHREEGLALQEIFQRLDGNPRARTVDFIYTKMGPKAEAVAVDLEAPAIRPRPEGPLLAGDAATPAPGRPVTAADIDGDGDIDLHVAGPQTEVLLNRGDGTFEAAGGHPLAGRPAVRAALWGDVDNDGRTDVYLCREGGNEMWRRREDGVWEDVTVSTGTGGGEYDTVDGAIFDADHDGDLDVFCVNADGPNELLNNNLDGTFRPIAAARGLAGDGRPSRQVLVADLDRDRDADIVVINVRPPHEVYLNDRLWSYRPVPTALSPLEVAACVAGDLDADGRVEVYARGPDGGVVRWRPDHDVIEPAATLAGDPPGAGGGLAVVDLDGDGVLELRSPGAWSPVVLDPARGVSFAARAETGGIALLRPGPGRHDFATLSLSGMEDPGQSMRSNASGIGAHLAARVGSRWTMLDTFRPTSGPGQSLQPVPVGLGGARVIDFVSIDWPDGVFQSEVGLAAAALHEIRETQRQVSSCPVLFAWDGERFAFVSDLLGVGGIGYMVEPGEYAVPRPRESFLLPPRALAPRGGRYALKLGEPMEETCYLDLARLVVYDLPPGWEIVLDERMGILGPEPTGEPRFYRDEALPARAFNDRGDDVTGLVSAADARAAPVGPLDLRFLGRLERPHVLTLEFDEPLTGRRGAPLLVADGWIEYPYSQTMFAAWQAGAAYAAPTIEARDADGVWHVVLEQFGYPAGMPRRMSVPLPDLPPGARALRLATNQEIYWDRLAVAFAEPAPPGLEVRRLDLESARVARSGFARRTTGPQRRPHYDYEQRSPFWDTRHQPGLYTELGPARALVAEADGALAIFGPGEEVHLEFRVDAGTPPAGWTRRVVLETRGWCKDMDLFTRDGETVAPLPGERDAPARALHERYNTRYEAGR